VCAPASVLRAKPQADWEQSSRKDEEAFLEKNCGMEKQLNEVRTGCRPVFELPDCLVFELAIGTGVPRLDSARPQRSLEGQGFAMPSEQEGSQSVKLVLTLKEFGETRLISPFFAFPGAALTSHG
jgi:hypothetical protein